MRTRRQQNLSLTFQNANLPSRNFWVNAMRRLKVSSPEREDLCGLFKPDFVLEQFKAMQTALTIDIFLDVFHKILNATCHRPPVVIRVGSSMKCNCWIGHSSKLSYAITSREESTYHERPATATQRLRDCSQCSLITCIDARREGKVKQHANSVVHYRVPLHLLHLTFFFF